jgi:hypothetical protein
MAQVVVYGRRESLNRRRGALSEAIHAAIMSALEYPPEKKFQRFIALDEADFVCPADRGADYTIIEITITETPKVNWGIRGRNAADLTLTYRVDV